MRAKSKKHKDLTTENPAAPLAEEQENLTETTEAATDAPSTPDSAAEENQAKNAQEQDDELTRIKNQYVRLMADFDNYRKRQSREREEYIKRANERLLGDILPVLDHLKLAIQKAESHDDPFISGVKLVHDQFVSILTRYGLEPIEAQGCEFNPELHEAISYIPSPTVPANKVIDQLRCGWLLTGHLMRAAQVIVSSGKPDEGDSNTNNISD